MMKKEKDMTRSGFTDILIEALARHPYIAMVLICMFVHVLSFGSVNNAPVGSFFFVTLFVVTGAAIWMYWKVCTGEYGRYKAILILTGCVILGLFTAKWYTSVSNKAVFSLAYGIVLFLLLYYLCDTNKYKEQKKSLFLMGMSFLVKFYYIFLTEIYTRQHDLSVFGAPEGTGGHAGYVEYLWKHHHLADVDPTSIYGFYHPPFYYSISALWLELNVNFFGVDFNRAAESLQILTLFYSMVITILAYRIFRFFGLKGKALYAALFIVAFHPTFILLSGSINNDILATAFMAGAALCALQWYQEQNLKNVIKIALCIGFGMMTKLSAALIAPPVAVLFLYVFLKKFRTDWKKLILQYGVFGIICIPLGMWYGIRNFVKWGVSFTYVQKIPVDQPQYLGNESVLHRIFDFSPYQFSSVYEQWYSAESNISNRNYNEHNPLIVLLKNSMFGEFIRDDTFKNVSWVNAFSTILFWTGVFLALSAFIFMLILCIKEREGNLAVNRFFGIIWLTMLFGYYQTAFQYPFVCTMDFRYIPFTVVIGAVFYGSYICKLQNGAENGVLHQRSRIVSELLFYISILFAVMATVVMVMLCLQ